MYLPDMFRPMLELSVVIPATILCFLPMRGHFRIAEAKLRWFGIPFLIVWAIIGGLTCYSLHWMSNLWLFPWLVAFCLFFRWVVELPAWKSVSVFLATCGGISCLTNLATVVDALYSQENHDPWFTYAGIWTHIVLCWLLLLLLWHPMTHMIHWLVEEIEMPDTWYLFWIFPVIFLVLNMFIQPQDYDVLYTGRMMVIYPVIMLTLLGLLLFCYLMFYFMARGISHGVKLAQENEVLQIQSAQYRILQKNMEDTRRARHDLRQHFIALQGYIENGDLQAVAEYVQSHMQMLPLEAPPFYCKNLAVNAVLHYYASIAIQEGMVMDITVRMEKDLLIPEPELCTLLGNLLENALDACEPLPGARFIQVQIQQRGQNILAIRVENTCPEEPHWQGEKLCSTKHEGLGFGTQSVRRIAEHYHGQARFTWKNGVFCAAVLLNP